MTTDRQSLDTERAELERQLADPDIARVSGRVASLSKRHAELVEIAELFAAQDRAQSRVDEAQSLADADDEDLRTIAAQDLHAAERELADVTRQLDEHLHPSDPNDDKDLILEIRAGAGGDEAGLFAGNLYRMYQRYAEVHGYSLKILNANRTGVGGYKEIIVEITGRGAYRTYKYESGVHRVQRIPETEKSGRIHTSTATVAVLPVAEEADVTIKPEELRIDVYRSGGHGGQSVNTTDSAVRITHIPTDTVVTCQDEKSQHKNREKAMKVLRARLLAAQQSALHEERDLARRSQIGTAERSEKIRTYNIPQDRVTDHRIKQSFSNVQGILEGNFDDILTALTNADRADRERPAAAQ